VLFKLEPKSSKEELYDLEDELDRLRLGLNVSRIILILGQRRLGKSSLLRTFLNEYNIPNILIDSRRILLSEGYITFRGFVNELSLNLTSLLNRYGRISSKLLKVLNGVRGVDISVGSLGPKISLSWSRRNRADIAEILDRLDYVASEENMKIVLAFDEAQELRNLAIDFPTMLAYIYDNLSNIVVILTGSQVGLLYDVLRIDDPRSPLYGRALYEIRMRRLGIEESKEFLKKGFEEIGIKVSDKFIDEAVEKLDGIIGWLTYFGWSIAYKGLKSIEEILDKAALQSLEELRGFLSKSRAERRYKVILKTLADKSSKWSVIKRALEAEEGYEIDDSNFSKLLKMLIKLNIVEKENNLYRITDPVMRMAIEKYL